MPMSFSQEHYEQRLARIRGEMEKEGFDAVIFSKCETVRYVTGFRRWYSYSWFYLREFALVTLSEGPVLLTDRGRVSRARADCFVTEVAESQLWPIPKEDRDAPLKTLAGVLGDLGVPRRGRVGLEHDSFPVDFYLRLCRFARDYEFDDFSPAMNRVIMTKFGEEIEAVRQTAELADIGLAAGVSTAQVGATEQEIAAAVDFAMMSAGAERVSHNVVRTGENAVTLNNIQTSRKVREGDIIQLDLGGIYAGYIADVNLTYHLGRCSPEQAELTRVALAMERAGLQAVRPGLSLAELREEMARPALEAGLAEAMVGDIGHGIGIYHQEFPKLAEDDGVLVPGMVLCLEPGLVMPGVGAARNGHRFWPRSSYQVRLGGLKVLLSEWKVHDT